MLCLLLGGNHHPVFPPGSFGLEETAGFGIKGHHIHDSVLQEHQIHIPGRQLFPGIFVVHPQVNGVYHGFRPDEGLCPEKLQVMAETAFIHQILPVPVRYLVIKRIGPVQHKGQVRIPLIHQPFVQHGGAFLIPASVFLVQENFRFPRKQPGRIVSQRQLPLLPCIVRGHTASHRQIQPVFH